MTGNSLLLFFLFAQVFIMGILAAIGVRYVLSHSRTVQEEPEPEQQPLPRIDIPPDVKERLLHASQAQFQAALKQSSVNLQKDLDVSAGHINNLVMRLASDIIAGEMEKYRLQLSQLHNQAEVEMSGISKEISKHQDELKAKMANEIEAEKQRLIKQIDARLGDAVGSFLLEALQHNVDLGNQGSYLVGLLEEHKSDFVKEVDDEAKPA